MISALFLITGIHSTTELNPFEQAKKFLTQQVQSSPEKSLKEKRHTFIGMCSLFT